MAATLAACATQTINDKLKTYVGQPASALIAKLGYPTRQDDIAGKKVYIWTTGQLVEGTSITCTIRAIVDTQGVIISWDWQGSEQGCANYASLISR